MMRPRRLLPFACVVALVLATPAAAQTWSAEQREVWTFISAQWTAAMEKNAAWVDNFLHEDFQGWSRTNPAPRDKASTGKWERYSNENSTTLVQDLFPLRIVVRGDLAVAHYLYQVASEDRDGERETTAGRYTDTLVKTKDGWRFLAWAGGEDPKDD